MDFTGWMSRVVESEYAPLAAVLALGLVLLAVVAKRLGGVVHHVVRVSQPEPLERGGTLPLSPTLRRLLEEHCVSPALGFLPDPEPLGRLPRGFEAWEALADSIPALLAAGQVRAFVHRLPLLDARRLRGEAELRRAYLILAVITQAFVWGVEGDPAQELPANLAVPFRAVADALQMPPILTHASIVLYNWRRLDPSRLDFSTSNLVARNLFLGGKDESFFFLVTVELEAEGARTLAPILRAQTDAAALRPTLDGGAVESWARRRVRDPRIVHDFDPGQSSSLDAAVTALAQQLRGTWTECAVEREEERAGEHEEGDVKERTAPRGAEGARGFEAVWRTLLGGVYSITVAECAVEQDGGRNASALLDRLLRPESRAARVLVDLALVEAATRRMTNVLARMHQGCDPYIFFHRIRPFLSGWNHNPALPDGLVYRDTHGRSERLHFNGGSAAQSSLLPALDALLGISHVPGYLVGSVSSSSAPAATLTSDAATTPASSTEAATTPAHGAFIRTMRAYMPRPHREFLERLDERRTVVRDVVEAAARACDDAPSRGLCLGPALRGQFDATVDAVVRFRQAHIEIVRRFILQPQQQHLLRGRPADEEVETEEATEARESEARGATRSQGLERDPGKASGSGGRRGQRRPSLGDAAGGKGTGGTGILEFLEPVVQDTREARLQGNPA